MKTLSHAFKLTSIAMLIGIAMPVFAESAPVYDADSLAQQFDNVGGGDPQAQAAAQAQDFPPPEQDGTFVPMQQPGKASAEAQSDDASAAPAAKPAASSTADQQRIRRLEQQLSEKQHQQGGDTTTRIESLQGQVQALRGQVEQLTHQLEVLQAQQKTQYSDLDKRLLQQQAATMRAPQPGEETKTADASIDTSSAAPAPVVKPTRAKASKSSKKTVAAAASAETSVSDNAATSKSATSQPNVAEEQQIYQTAYNLIKAKKYNDAVGALQGMLQKYPSGQFASNAHYWLGELYGLLGKNDQALTEFSSVVKTYPESPRISDAQLKVGLILASQFKWADAKTAFKKVINRYPGTASARLASEQLKQIKQAGH